MFSQELLLHTGDQWFPGGWCTRSPSTTRDGTTPALTRSRAAESSEEGGSRRGAHAQRGCRRPSRSGQLSSSPWGSWTAALSRTPLGPTAPPAAPAAPLFSLPPASSQDHTSKLDSLQSGSVTCNREPDILETGVWGCPLHKGTQRPGGVQASAR